jgi:putative thioredoxin
VADLTPARSEGQLKQALDQVLGQLPIKAGGGEPDRSQEIAQFVAMGEQILADGDGPRAAGIFRQVVEMAPDEAAAHAGLVRALVSSGETDEAKSVLAAAEANPEVADDPAIAQARSALELAGDSVDDDTLATLREAALDGSMEDRFAYAEAAYAAGRRDEAADELLAMIEADRDWDEGAAKAKLLQIFEAVGLEDPWVVATRRRLSKLLFG